MSSGNLIPVAATEDQDYPVTEGCFFGNLFNGTGVFSGTDSADNDPAIYSSPRACAMDIQSMNTCAPMISTGISCSRICTRAPGSSTAYDTCGFGWWRFRAINTRIQSSEVYVCGDGTCQFTETCYNPTTGSGCASDCGISPAGGR